MTELRVDLASPVPVYEQIRAQVAALVAVGLLTQGDRLPASRDLARDLGIAVGTVQRAYRELEASGVVLSRRRTGTVIAPVPAGAASAGPVSAPEAIAGAPAGAASAGAPARTPAGGPVTVGPQAGQVGAGAAPAGAASAGPAQAGTGSALIAQARALVAAARAGGLSDDAVLDLVRGALHSPEGP